MNRQNGHGNFHVNVHGNAAAPDNETRHVCLRASHRQARFPHSIPPPQAGEGANESLREFHVNTFPAQSAQQGVMLIEAMIAILIFSVGVLGIVGLQAAMIKNTADAKYRADASYIAQQRIGLMWSDPDNTALGAYLEANTDISALLPGGTRTVTQPVIGQFVVTVTWQQPGLGEVRHNFTTTANITGG